MTSADPSFLARCVQKLLEFSDALEAGDRARTRDVDGDGRQPAVMCQCTGACHAIRGISPRVVLSHRHDHGPEPSASRAGSGRPEMWHGGLGATKGGSEAHHDWLLGQVAIHDLGGEVKQQYT